MRKKLITIMALCTAAVMLVSCGTKKTGSDATNSTTAQTASQVEFQGGGDSSNHILVAYFSYFDNTDNTDGENIMSNQYADAMASASVTVVDGKRRGNNDIVADMLKEQTGADVFSILTKEQYSPDYDGGFVQQALEDGKNQLRPELASEITNLDQYDTVILLFPTWWYDMPMAVYTFLDQYDFSGKTIAPVATSGGSGLVDTVAAIKKAEPQATVTEGLAIAQESVVDAAPDISSWLAKTGINNK